MCRPIVSVIVIILASCLIDATSNIRNTKSRNFSGKRQTQRSPVFVLRCPSPSRTRHSHKFRISVAFYFNNSLVLQIDNGTITTFDKLRDQTEVIRWKTVSDYNSAIILWKNGIVRFEYEEKRHWYAMRIKSEDRQELRGTWKCRMLMASVTNGEYHKAKFESRKWYEPQNTFFTVFKNITAVEPTMEYERVSKRVPIIKEAKRETVKKKATHAMDDTVTFTKPNEDFTVFHRMSRYREVAYIRNSDIKEDSRDDATQVGKITYFEENPQQRNYSSVHALPANTSTKNNVTLLFPIVIVILSQIF